MVPKRSTVGRSSRTPIKHFLLDQIVGKIAGALGTGNVPCKPNPFYVVDLCGGDGRETKLHQASPIILHKHCQWMRNKRGKASVLDVIELHEGTFEELQGNVSHLDGYGDWMTTICDDSRNFTLPPMKPDQAAFVHCDPNTVDQTPLTGPMVESWNIFTTYLVTLGCNVGGLKMLPLDKRAVWFDYVDLLCNHLPRHHDAVLFWLNRDASQWAYLLSIPRKWSESFSEYAVRKTSNSWERGVSAASFRFDRRSFNDNIRRLFLRGDEYGEC